MKPEALIQLLVACAPLLLLLLLHFLSPCLPLCLPFLCLLFLFLLLLTVVLLLLARHSALLAQRTGRSGGRPSGGWQSGRPPG